MCLAPRPVPVRHKDYFILTAVGATRADQGRDQGPWLSGPPAVSWLPGAGEAGVSQACPGGTVIKTVIVYESMYGNTHAVAEAIGQGLGSAGEVTVVPVARASQELLRHHGFTVITEPESFLVTKANELQQGETARAIKWGAPLAAKAATTTKAAR